MRPLPEEETARPVNREESVPVPMKEEYKPSADDLRRRHTIVIEFLDSGCIVRIGCKSIAFTNYLSAMSQLNEYVKDPIAAYKKWSAELNVSLDY
jgi:hypothetical protein